ncbi:MAG: MFS transporter [bacterium]
MIARFCLYSILKNFRPFSAFFVIYLILDPAAGGLGLDLFTVGLLIGYERLLVAAGELPLGVLADRFGRRRALAACFGSYVVAFSGWAIAATQPDKLALGVLFFAQTAYAIGEAFRTGTHKAIMLDWVDSTQETSATHVVALTRTFSKLTEGITAFAGGVLLWRSGSLAWLFWSAVPAAIAGIGLSLSYPRWLEGEMTRRQARPSLREGFLALARRPGLAELLLLSVGFEVACKLAQTYLQPFLERGLDARDVAIVGGRGALVLGTFYFAYGFVGGIGASSARHAERWFGARGFALVAASWGAALTCAGLVVLPADVPVAVLGAGFIVLSLLQNARRPVFVATLNRLMDGAQRATTLSVESQGRSAALAVLAPLTGWIADRAGLDAVFLLLAVSLAALGGVGALRARRGLAAPSPGDG